MLQKYVKIFFLKSKDEWINLFWSSPPCDYIDLIFGIDLGPTSRLLGFWSPAFHGFNWISANMKRNRPRRWSIFRAMRCRWFIFQQRCDTDYFWEKLNIAIVAIIFLDHRGRLFFDYFAHFRTDYFAIIHWLTGIIRKEVILEIRCSVTSWLCTTG